LYAHRHGSISLLRLADLFHLPRMQEGKFLYGLVSNEGERSTALVVDGLLGLREAVVRRITDPLVTRPGISGATELGDGSIILILDIPSLFKFLKRKNEVRHA
jgi:two-component system chemotaxis sensor kinase CheA